MVFIVPAADRDVALGQLRARSLLTKGTSWSYDGHDLLGEWLDDQGSRSLATQVVFTGAETPEQTAARLVQIVRTDARAPSRTLPVDTTARKVKSLPEAKAGPR